MNRHATAIIGGLSLKLSRPGDYYQKLGSTGGRPRKSQKLPPAPASDKKQRIVRDYQTLLKLCPELCNGGARQHSDLPSEPEISNFVDHSAGGGCR